MSSIKQTISHVNIDNELAIHHEILDFTGNIIWVWELSTNKVTIYGDTHLRYGFSTDDALDTMEFWSSIVHKEDKPALQKKYNSLFKGETEQLTHTYRIINSHNEILWERLKSRVYKYDDDGKIASIISITNFYDTLEAIENNSNEIIPVINKAFAGSGDSLWGWDLTNDTINISDVWRIGLGLSPDQAIYAAKSWAPNIHPDDLEASSKAMLSLIKQEADNLNITYRIMLAGHFRWISVRGNIIERSSTGTVKRIVGIITDIDTRKAQELLLQERDNQFSLSMLSTKSSLVEYDLTDRSFNHVGFKQENGRIISTATKITLDPLPTSIHPDDLPMVEKFTDSLSNSLPLIKECTWRSTLGGDGYRWYKTLAHITAWDESGQAIKVTGIRQDITDAQNILVEREQILKREEIAYKDTYHSVYEWDLITNKIFFSPHFIAKITLDVSQWHHHIDDWKACVHPDDIGPAEKALEKGLSAEKPYVDITYRIRTNNGDWIWVNGKGKVEVDADGAPIRSFGTVIDITDLKKSELALENEKEWAQTTLESINEAVITTDKRGKILTLNHTAEKLFQLNAASAYDLGFNELCQLREESANDYAGNYNPIELCLQSESAFNISKLALINNNGSTFSIDCSVSPLHSNEKEIIGCVMVIRDVTRERKIAAEIEHRAKHDTLTGIRNRHAFEIALDDLTQFDDHQHVLCYIDLDQFKIVNDTCGHMAGDELLRQLTDSMQQTIRKSDVFARLGGDEFGVLMKDCDLAHAFKVAGQIKDTITDYTFHWKDKTFQLGASIGLANINNETSPTNALQHADAACFSAKEQGRNRIHAYRLDDDEMMKAQGQMSWVPRIQKALLENHFVLYAQAITDLQDSLSKPSHFEILIRLKEDDKIIPPGGFLPAAERYNLATKIDRWVIEHTFKVLNEFNQDITEKDIFNINLSAPSLTEHGFLKFIQQEFVTSQINPSQICFEITETAAVTNLSAANKLIVELKKMGCSFALDDFGSGLSSFGYLKNFPVDYLKIDGSFVKDLIDDPIDAAMVKSINEIGQIMGKQTVAEFVENQEIADVLTQMGVNYAQGYHFSVPSPLIDMLKSR